MRVMLRAASAVAILWTSTAICRADETAFDDATSVLGNPAETEIPTFTFSEDGINQYLTPERRFFEDPELQLVQREEPITGITPEEQTLRRRVQQAETQTYGPGVGYDYRQPAAYGPNSLLPSLYGGYGGYDVGLSTGKRWYVSVAQTADYVTNLALPLFVTPGNVVTTLQDDAQFQTNVYAQYRIFGNQKHSLTTAFNYYQSLHPNVEQLDLFSYSSLTQYTRVLSNRVTAFANYTYSYYFLDHDSLLSRNGLGSGFTAQTRDRTFWTVAYNFGDNTYRLDPTQTSQANFIQFQRLKYIACTNLYWLAGYAYGHNSARFNAWSYDVHSFSLGGGLNYGRCLRNNFYILGNYGNYEYLGVNTPLGDTTRRLDDIWSVTTRWTRNIGPHSAIFTQWTYFNSNSNIARQDFNSTLYSVGGLLAW